MKVTNHAKKRLKKRLGLPKSAIESHAQKAFDAGLTHKAAKGAVSRYMSGLFGYNKAANNIRLYGEFAWIFAGDSLVTVLPIPARFKKSYHSQRGGIDNS